MQGLFEAVRLRSTEARSAYVLVGLLCPQLSLGHWTREVRNRDRKGVRAGFMTIRDGRGIIHAIYSYDVRPGFWSAATLEISEPIVAALPGRHVDTFVSQSIENLAADLDCEQVVLKIAYRTSDDGTLGDKVLEVSRAVRTKAAHHALTFSF